MKEPAFGLLLVLTMIGAVSAQGEAPQPGRGRGAVPRNLQVLPKDTAPQDVAALMQQFTTALGVQCTYCHVQNTPPPLTAGKPRRRPRCTAGRGGAAAAIRRWTLRPTTNARNMARVMRRS
jgi:hypothetical protein